MTGAVEFPDARRLSQHYEMVLVCRTCYLIYHCMDAERFQVAQATAKEATQRASAIYTSQLAESERATLPTNRRRGARINIPEVTAWAAAAEADTSRADFDGEDDDSS